MSVETFIFNYAWHYSEISNLLISLTWKATFSGHSKLSKAQSSIQIDLQTMRHSCAHILAAAIRDVRPDVKFGIGPATENGFYYDIQVDNPINFDDIKVIERTMRKYKDKRIPFEMAEISVDSAAQIFALKGQVFKIELLELLKARGSIAVCQESGDKNILINSGLNTVSIYSVAGFKDLCAGPHVDHTGQIGEFKLQNISSAYWRGDEKNPQMQRIYGLCFRTKEELEHEIWRQEQAKLRDHRRLGKELNLFRFSDDIGSGLPIWLPKGTVLRDELSYLAMQMERRGGYERVVTPSITKESLYYRSGHLPYYKDDMYQPINIDGENFYLRPMNCPHHHEVYLSQPRSHRDLPLRISEYGDVFRYEASGALSGLMRTRSFCQNDAHIYCSVDDAKLEFVKVMHLHASYYVLMGITDFYMRLSLPDLEQLEKYINEPEKWMEAYSIIVAAMKDSGYKYIEVKGEAAFYGPKVDFMVKSAVGTEYAISTNQLDFLATERFNLNFTGEDALKHPVYVIHRAPLGSHERFVAFLIEHYAGAFPTWLAPIQICVVPVTDKHIEYALKVKDFFFEANVQTGTGGLRVHVDNSTQRMQKKIRKAQLEKIPYILVVGDKETETGGASVRLRSGEDLGILDLEFILTRISTEVSKRTDFRAL